MGYYTRYNLSIDYSQLSKESEEKKEFEIKEIQQSNITDELKTKLISNIEESYELKKITKNDVINLLSFSPFKEQCRWYDHEFDMRRVSKHYKDVLFTLKGEGEESEDLWVKYFLNGKMQTVVARITFDDFDPSKLC
jgi:NAD+--asparagine ADP-ribosyltransferase